jgi:hypothetical protein
MDDYSKALTVIVSTLKIQALLASKQNLESEIHLPPIHYVLFLPVRHKTRAIILRLGQP